MKIISILFFFN